MINQDPIVYDVNAGKNPERVIYTEINQGLNFDVSQEDKDRMINKGYESALQHINEYLLK